MTDVVVEVLPPDVIEVVASGGTAEIVEVLVDGPTGPTGPQGPPGETPGLEKLTADRTLYVRLDGNDANDGLADTAGGALRTVQAALDKARLIDLNNHNFVVQIRDGTFSGVLRAASLPAVAGVGNCYLKGNYTNPSACVLTITDEGGSGRVVDTEPFAVWTVGGFKFTSPAAASALVVVHDHGRINIEGKVEYADGWVHNWVTSDGYLEFWNASPATVIISGPSFYHLLAGAATVDYAVESITITDTVAIDTFAVVNSYGQIFVYIDSGIITGKGLVTGRRYTVQDFAVLDTGGGGETTLPGTTTGVVKTYGIYR